MSMTRYNGDLRDIEALKAALTRLATVACLDVAYHGEYIERIPISSLEEVYWVSSNDDPYVLVRSTKYMLLFRIDWFHDYCGIGFAMPCIEHERRYLPSPDIFPKGWPCTCHAD